MQLSELVKVLEEEYPIAPDQKALRYTDEYGLLETEIQKLTSLYGEKPDYKLIQDSGVLLLKQGSRHAYVITAIAYAMLQQYAWPGFLEGVHFVSARLQGGEQFGGWLIERYQQYLAGHPINGLAKDFIEKMCRALEAWKLETAVILRRPFEDEQKRMKQEEQVRETNARLADEQKAREAEKKLDFENNPPEEAVEEIEEDAYLNFIKENPFEFAAYKYARAEMWWRLPLSSQEILNLIDDHSLSWQAYSEALKLKALQNYEEALLAFEALAHRYPYFLDLQFHICDCLEELEADESLLAMLKSEMRALCLHYPELEGAKINNEFAVCSKQTKEYFAVFTKI